MTAQPWWLVSSASENGKPWDVITFQGSAADAKGEGLSVGGYPKGPFPSAAAAVAWGKAHNVAVINDPAASSGNPLTSAGSAVSGGADSLASQVGLSGVDAIGAFFNNLGEASTWIRVAKVAVGGVLLIIGIAHMSGADNAVATLARKAPLPV